MSDESLARLQAATTLSMYAWAAYWPGGGLLLTLAGMADPASLLFTAAGLGLFTFLLVRGLLRAPALPRTKAFLAQRPIYILAGLAVVAIASQAFGFLRNTGLALFSALFLASLALVMVRLRQHLRASGQGAIASRADQVYLLIGLVGLFAVATFLDMVFQAARLDAAVGAPAAAVAIANLFSLAYPPLMLLASRPFRAGAKAERGEGVAPASAAARRDASPRRRVPSPLARLRRRAPAPDAAPVHG